MTNLRDPFYLYFGDASACDMKTAYAMHVATVFLAHIQRLIRASVQIL